MCLPVQDLASEVQQTTYICPNSVQAFVSIVSATRIYTTRLCQFHRLVGGMGSHACVWFVIVYRPSFSWEGYTSIIQRSDYDCDQVNSKHGCKLLLAGVLATGASNHLELRSDAQMILSSVNFATRVATSSWLALRGRWVRPKATVFYLKLPHYKHLGPRFHLQTGVTVTSKRLERVNANFCDGEA